MNFFAELTKEKISCAELKVQDYKEILKCSYGDEPNKEIFIETLTSIFAKLSNKPQEYFKQNLSIFDLFLMLLDVRIHSLGDAINIVVTKDNNQAKFELNLKDFKKFLLDFFNKHKQLALQDNHIRIVFNFPLVERLLEPLEEEYLYFLDEVFFHNKTFKIQTNKQAQELFDKLPPKLASKFIDNFKEFIVDCQKNNFLENFQVQQTLTFIPTIESLIWYTKLFFNETLETFYDNMFYLSYLGHLELSYINSLGPGEYSYMVRKLEQTLNQKNRQNEPPSNDYDISGDNFDDSGMFEDSN